MELIVTEKDNAARRIAEILSDGTATTERNHGIDVYRWNETRVIGLSGHVVGVDFPDMYSDWRDVEPAELVEADVIKQSTRPDIVTTLQSLTKDADRVVIATDYDREGELIGKEAYELVRDVKESVPVNRVRFSSLTEGEVRSAFENPDELDFDLAAAGEARQIIDLLWGASLTRFLSLSAGQLGDDFLSVGRVQTPTLKLLVDREREIRAFEPTDYWELFAELDTDDELFEAQYVYRDEEGNQTERIWEESAAEATQASVSAVEVGTVRDVNRRTRIDHPPIPFNTTEFISAAGSIGYSASRAMNIAEDLYTSGYVTYPRTDNTVYPDDLDLHELLAAFIDDTRFDEDANSLLDGPLDPTAGDEETTDHPPLHPTGEVPQPNELSEDAWDVYELIVRRFFSTLADPARWHHLRVEVEANGATLKANGKRLIDPGYHAVYPYFSTDENYVPTVEEGESLGIRDVRLEAKQTQPPRRYGQSRLVEEMESLGLGTKATRHGTIDKLYNRGYVEGNPPRPTELAMAIVEAAEQYAETIVDESMTSQLERDMQAIATGEETLSSVTDESRTMLETVFNELTESRDDIGDHLRESLKADKTIGPCPECEENLLVRQSGDGSYFVGCDGYPNCRFTLPLPNSGQPLVLDESCDRHDLNHVKMLAGRNTFIHGCPRCRVSEADEHEETTIGACPTCGEEAGGSAAIKLLGSGSRLVGCTRYPKCDFSVPLPRHGEIEVRDSSCSDHQLRELRVHDGDDPWDLGCPLCNFREYQARESDSGTDLEALDGVGTTTAEKLMEAGIDSIDALSGADPEDLAKSLDGVSADQLREWQAQA